MLVLFLSFHVSGAIVEAYQYILANLQFMIGLVKQLGWFIFEKYTTTGSIVVASNLSHSIPLASSNSLVLYS